MKTIKDIPKLKGQRVLLRLDLNVAIEKGHVTDDFRIKESFPTIDFLRKAGARIIILSHIEGKSGDTLEPVYNYLHKHFPIRFVNTCTGAAVESAVSVLRDGELLLLENLRRNPGEKGNDPEFGKYLAMLGDIYVNEAFPASHRAHASIVGIPSHLHGYAGLRLASEVENLSRAFKPPHPFVFVLGGAKFDTKIPLINKFLQIADTVFIGGALANDCFKACGWNVGASVVSTGEFDLKSIVENKKVMLPIDVIVERGKKKLTISSQEVKDGDKIWDAGPATLKLLDEKIASAKAVLWNGPLGNYEIGYTKGTEELAKAIAKNSGALSIVGGGDTVTSIKNLGLDRKFSFLSTGGGAMLEFLANETLPGIDALNKSFH